MEPEKHTFQKKERLCSKKRIEALFAGGSRSITAYPLRVVFAPNNREGENVQLLISVSKRRFKHAVDRNRIKRLIREAYRLNKHILLDQLDENERIDMAFIWMSDELSDFANIESKVKNLLQRVGESEKVRG